MTKETLIPVRHEEVAVCGEYILAAVTEDGKAYFSPRHVCDALGIAWTGQRVKIMDDDVLKLVVKEIFTTGRDGKTYKMSMLPIEFANGWLFTIKKVRPELQAKLNLFRAEAYHALDLWFRKGLRYEEDSLEALGLPDFESPAEAARAWAEEREQRIELEAENATLRPKAKVYETCFADRQMSVVQFARTLHGVNSMKVKEDLMRAGYLRRSGGVYRVRGKFRDKFFAERISPFRGFVTIIALDGGKEKMVELYLDGKLTMRRGFEHAHERFFDELDF
ncbi:Phage P22, antirepressor protein [Oleidesulfovibrio alaskensis G20]|uniref:Phage P22, antirepressor protein n=1 Tax=Oleidesulfovibrio alaskensis (strain ATCC BAA-1058 / DSM 17464 / G20) TaxID=207559 RepID=Q30XK4_OLEA2|nr:phage antirepressor N-terminal domain-containing protein [Oleidesulfovibrio alaskensis]ABB39592.1 Phage P22, antirepressor protein [Oleidesulfovibrio alaskensis G20]